MEFSTFRVHLGSSFDPGVHIFVNTYNLLVNKRFRSLTRLSSSNGDHARKLDDVTTRGSETSGLDYGRRTPCTLKFQASSKSPLNSIGSGCMRIIKEVARREPPIIQIQQRR